MTTAAFSAVMLFAAPTASADNNLNIALSENFLWDSNPLNRISNDDDIYGFETRALVSYDRSTDNFEWGTDFTLLHERFDDSDFNSTDFYFDMDAAWSTPISQLIIDGGYDYDTTRDEDNTVLGSDINAERRQSWTLAPQYSRRLTERFSFQLGGQWQETRYDDDELTDFRTVSASPSLVYSLSPLQTASLGARVRRYEPLDIDGRQVDSFGPEAAWSYNFHPNYTISMSGGYLGTSFEGYPGIDDDTEYNPIYSVMLQYQGEDSTASLGVTRSRQAFADGTESDQTSLNLNVGKDINEHIDIGVTALYQNAEQDTSTGSNFDSALAQSVVLNYKLGRRWSASLRQKYRQEEYDNQSGEAKRHTIRIGLQYNLNDVY